MQSMFPGYRKKSTEDIAKIWRDAIFIFDTNVLLHVYRYKPELQTQLLNAWDVIKERVWLPYQVALEYHRHYLQTAGEQKTAYRAMRQTIDTTSTALQRKLQDQHDKNRDRFLSIVPDEVMAAIQKGFDEAKQLIAQAESTVPDQTAVDQARSRIDALFAGRIGEPYSAERQREVYEEAARRFIYGIPPGFADAGKGGIDQFGDVVLWFQVLDFARSQPEPKRPIIFVTDDVKADWWEGEHPHPALAQELFERAGVQFLQLQADQFLRDGKAQQQFSIEEEVIEEVREVSEASADSQSATLTGAQQFAREQSWAGISREMNLFQEPFSEQLARRAGVPGSENWGAMAAGASFGSAALAQQFGDLGLSGIMRSASMNASTLGHSLDWAKGLTSDGALGDGLLGTNSVASQIMADQSISERMREISGIPALMRDGAMTKLIQGTVIGEAARAVSIVEQMGGLDPAKNALRAAGIFPGTPDSRPRIPATRRSTEYPDENVEADDDEEATDQSETVPEDEREDDQS